MVSNKTPALAGSTLGPKDDCIGATTSHHTNLVKGFNAKWSQVQGGDKLWEPHQPVGRSSPHSDQLAATLIPARDRQPGAAPKPLSTTMETGLEETDAHTEELLLARLLPWTSIIAREEDAEDAAATDTCLGLLARVAHVHKSHTAK